MHLRTCWLKRGRKIHPVTGIVGCLCPDGGTATLNGEKIYDNPAVKRRIVLEFRSFARSQELRQQVTQAVKLAENQLRARTKIKARLSTEGYAPDVAAAVAEYFGEKLPMQKLMPQAGLSAIFSAFSKSS